MLKMNGKSLFFIIEKKIFSICIISYLILLYLLLFSFNSLAAMQGRPPNLNPASVPLVESRIGFKVESTVYSGSSGLFFNLSPFIRFNDVIFHADFSGFGDDDIIDEDGDTFGSIESVLNSFSWFDKKGDLIAEENLNEPLGSICNIHYKGPYKLVISSQIKVSTLYGYPRSYQRPATVKIYTISDDASLCYFEASSFNF